MSADNVCPDCKYERPKSSIPFGTPIEFMPGATIHSADCPQVAWMKDAQKKIAEECGLFYRGSLIFSVQTSERAQSLAAHFNATGYLP